MLLCTQTHALGDSFGPEEAVQILAEVGYDAIDMSFFEMEQGRGPWLRDDWKEHAIALRALADSLKICFRQAHAPFPSSKGSEPYDTEIRRRIIRSMEVSSILGVKNIIVHPMQHLTYQSSKKTLFDMNVAFYRSLIPECERLNIRVCAENMWQHDKKRGYIVDSVCSQPEEFVSLLDEIGSPWIGGCLDLGHTALVGIEPQDFIRQMGKDHLNALHVHDVNYIRDCHTMPYMEKLNWDEICKALAETGYEGDFTFEADNFLFNLPQELQKDGAQLMEKVGRHLVAKIESYQASKA
ncbi:MAG: sugar phosphate isomerase/epimerase [Firmicutes bacterium]|nr:sugar phosphate isomerase/epimerase [Bacillota bacterium]